MIKPLPSIEEVHTVVFDFDGVFTDNMVWVDQEGRESVCCDRGDGLAFDLVRAFQKRTAADTEFFVLSKESNPVVLARAQKLKLPCHHDISDKLTFMTDYLAVRFPSKPAPFDGVIYLGNDLNDLPVMRRSGYSVAPLDAHPKVCEVADLVLTKIGGKGAVREFIESFLRIDQLTNEALDELISDC